MSLFELSIHVILSLSTGVLIGLVIVVRHINNSIDTMQRKLEMMREDGGSATRSR